MSAETELDKLQVGLDGLGESINAVIAERDALAEQVTRLRSEVQQQHVDLVTWINVAQTLLVGGDVVVELLEEYGVLDSYELQTRYVRQVNRTKALLRAVLAQFDLERRERHDLPFQVDEAAALAQHGAAEAGP